MTRPGGSWATFLFLPRCDVICDCEVICRQRQNGIYLLNRSQMTSQRVKNTRRSRVAWLLFFTRCDVFCDLLQYTHMEKCNLFVLYNKNSNGLLKDLGGMKKEKQVCWRDLTWIWRHLCACPLIDQVNNQWKCTQSRYGIKSRYGINIYSETLYITILMGTAFKTSSFVMQSSQKLSSSSLRVLSVKNNSQLANKVALSISNIYCYFQRSVVFVQLKHFNFHFPLS